MVSTKWCLMHRSGSVSPRCGCPFSLALLLLADWTKPSRGQHIKTSSRPEGGPKEIRGFMIDPPQGPRALRDVQSVTFPLLFLLRTVLSVFHPSCQALTKWEGCLCLCPVSKVEGKGQRALGRKVAAGLLRRSAPSPAVWIWHSLEEEHKQEGISGNSRR